MVDKLYVLGNAQLSDRRRTKRIIGMANSTYEDIPFGTHVCNHDAVLLFSWLLSVVNLIENKQMAKHCRRHSHGIVIVFSHNNSSRAQYKSHDNCIYVNCNCRVLSHISKKIWSGSHIDNDFHNSWILSAPTDELLYIYVYRVFVYS